MAVKSGSRTCPLSVRVTAGIVGLSISLADGDEDLLLESVPDEALEAAAAQTQRWSSMTGCSVNDPLGCECRDPEAARAR